MNYQIALATGLLLIGAATAVPAQGGSRGDSAVAMPPAGLGTLRQDLISIRFTVGALDIRFVPLEESLLRLLAPDAYQGLAAVLTSQRRRIDSLAAARNITRPGVAMVSFYATAPNTRFDPRQFAVVLPSRRMQPIGIIPLSPEFSNQQLNTREQASGLLVFERAIPTLEAFSVSYLSTVIRDWESMLPRLDAERARIQGKMQRDSLERRP